MFRFYLQRSPPTHRQSLPRLEVAFNDSLSLAVPGAQVLFIRGARIRLEAQEGWSIIGDAPMTGRRLIPH